MDKKVVGFGEIMMRLTPTNHSLIKDSELYHVYYGGSETNVLITLSSLGLKTDYVSVIPENSIGEGAIRHLTKNNVNISNVVRKGDHLGIYFVEEGFGERPSNVIYNRDNSAVRDIDINDLDEEKIFTGASAYFTSGISLALSTKTSDVAVDLAKKAKEMGVTVIFDFNYRSKLWSVEEAKEKFKEIIPYADVCFGNLFDIKTFFDIEGDDDEVIKTFLTRYNIKYLVHTKRTVFTSSRNALKGFAYFVENEKLQKVETKEYAFDILDRVGGGDAFAGGVIYGLMKDWNNPTEAVRIGVACDVLKHCEHGDAFTQSIHDVNAFLLEQSKDIKR